MEATNDVGFWNAAPIADEVARVAAEVLSKGYVLGAMRGYSVGPLTMAVEDEHPWCIISRRCQIVARAHDLFEVALRFVRLEAGAESEPAGEDVVPSDAEAWAAGAAERREQSAWLFYGLDRFYESRRAAQAPEVPRERWGSESRVMVKYARRRFLRALAAKINGGN
jgi:hypothetical protein